MPRLNYCTSTQSPTPGSASREPKEESSHFQKSALSSSSFLQGSNWLDPEGLLPHWVSIHTSPSVYAWPVPCIRACLDKGSSSLDGRLTEVRACLSQRHILIAWHVAALIYFCWGEVSWPNPNCWNWPRFLRLRGKIHAIKNPRNNPCNKLIKWPYRHYSSALAIIVQRCNMQKQLVAESPGRHPKPRSQQINNPCNFVPVRVIAGAIFTHLTSNSSK